MAKAKKKPRDLKNPPETLRECSKDFMLLYVKEKGTDEDKQWFKTLCLSNIITRENKGTQKKTQDIDIAVVRRAFCERFDEFKDLLPHEESFIDILKKL